MAKGQAEHLFPMLEAMLAGVGVGWSDLSGLAVGIGPGNFTGVRLSVSAARGLALGLKIPVHGVSRFEATAHGLPRPCLVALDARSGRVYLQLFNGAGHPPLITNSNTIPERLVREAACLAGDAAGSITAHGRHPVMAAALTLPHAMARIAAARPPPATRPAPLYLLPADAAPPRDAPPVILP